MNRKLYLYTLVAALGGLLFGFDTAVINGALPYFKIQFNLTHAMEGWAVSSAIVGCVIGALGIGRLGDAFGRRTMLKVVALFFFISAAGAGLSPGAALFILFRIIGGMAIGGASVLSPMYISEIAPAASRGRLAITFQLAIVAGILVAFSIDLMLMNTGIHNWRWMFISGTVPALLFFILLFFVDRSPRWLVKKGLNEEARQVLEAVNPGTDSRVLLEEIRKSIDSEVIEHLKFLFKKPYRKLILVGMAIGMFNQLTGIAVVMIYSSEIFGAAGFSNSSSILQTVIIGITNLTFTLLAMMLIDTIGRKRMLLIGSAGMSIFLAAISVIYFRNLSGYLPLLFMISFVGCFAFSQGAVIWVLLAEMFPNNIRARGSSFGSFAHWLFYALLLFLFPVVRKFFPENLGIALIFGFFSLATLGGFFFFRKYLVETRGKSLEKMG